MDGSDLQHSDYTNSLHYKINMAFKNKEQLSKVNEGLVQQPLKSY